MSTKIDAPADDITVRYILREGSTLYVLNANGTNLWSAHVQPGHTDGGQRLPDAECERIAAILADRASTSRADGWLPIETAQEDDGSTVWLHEAGKVFQGAWIKIPFREIRDEHGAYVDQQDPDSYWMNFDSGDRCEPTEWAPIHVPGAPGTAHAASPVPAAMDVGAAQAETAQAAPVVPAGYALVPLEPTEDMLFAAELSKPRGYRDLYAAMVAAATPGATHGNN